MYFKIQFDMGDQYTAELVLCSRRWLFGLLTWKLEAHEAAIAEQEARRAREGESLAYYNAPACFKLLGKPTILHHP